MMKACRKCGIEKPLVDFPRVDGCTDGHSWSCKACILKQNQERDLIKRPLETRPQYQAKALFDRGLKKCSKCAEVKELSEFTCCQKRFTALGGYKASCKACDKAKYKVWADSHDRSAYYAGYDNRPDVKVKKISQRRLRAIKSPRIVMQITLAHGLRRVRTSNPATIDDLMSKFEAQQGLCALTGIRMTWAKGKVLPTSISLDRIDHRQGYSSDNLRLVCHAVNAFKGQMTDEEMIVMARLLVAKADADSAEPSWRGFGYSAPIHTFTVN